MESQICERREDTVWHVNAEGEKEKIEAELWGPVETDPGSSWWCGAQRGTNNTGELMGDRAGTDLAEGFR